MRSSRWVSVDRGCWREAAIRRGVRTKAKRAAKQGGRGVRGDRKVRDLFPRLVFRFHWRQRPRIQRTQRRTTRKKDPRVEEVTGRARSLAQSGFCESSNQLSNSSLSCSSTNPLLRSSSSINQGEALAFPLHLRSKLPGLRSSRPRNRVPPLSEQGREEGAHARVQTSLGSGHSFQLRRRGSASRKRLRRRRKGGGRGEEGTRVPPSSSLLLSPLPPPSLSYSTTCFLSLSASPRVALRLPPSS